MAEFLESHKLANIDKADRQDMLLGVKCMTFIVKFQSQIQKIKSWLFMDNFFQNG